RNPTQAKRLLVLYAAKSQVNSWMCDIGVLGYLVLEVLLRTSGHDQEAAMRQELRVDHGPAFASKPKQPLRTQTERSDQRPHLRFIVGVQSNAVASVAIEIA